MRILGCGILSLTLIYIGVTPLFKSLAFVFGLLILKSKEIKLHALTKVFFAMLSNIFGGFGLLYSCFAYRKTFLSNQHNLSLIQAQFQFKSVKHHNKCEMCFNVFLQFLIGLMLMIQAIMQAYIAFTIDLSQENKKSNLKYELTALEIFFLCILSNYILHYSLYRHQVISLIIIIIGMLLILFPNIVYEKKLALRLPLYCFEYLLSSLRYVLEKYIMEQKFISAYQILFFEGLFSSCLCIIFGFIIEEIPFLKKMLGSSMIIFSEFGNAITINPLIVVLEFVFTVFYNVCAMMLKYYYTPMHCSVTALITSLVMWIFIISEKLAVNDNYAQVAIGYVIMMFGLLIYIEIIICYVWDLHVNTKKEIEHRSKFQENSEILLATILPSDNVITLKLI